MKTTKRFYLCIFFITISLTFLISGCKKEEDGTLKDIDGNIYTTVTIGTQVWMVGNLKTTRLNDGTDIPLVSEKAEWSSAVGSSYCWYDNNLSNKDPYGALYNWYAVNTGKLCPKGWKVPSESELKVLVNFLGGKSVAGGKLKTTGTIEGGNGLWYQPNVDATNETGLSIVPGGYRGASGNFFDFGYGGVWWTSTAYPSGLVYYFYINNFNGEVGDSDNGIDKKSGLSVRCLKE